MRPTGVSASKAAKVCPRWEAEGGCHGWFLLSVRAQPKDCLCPPPTSRAPAEGRELAEREGFEPPVGLLLHLISSQARSTGLRHLSAQNRLLSPACGLVVAQR